MRLSVRMKRRLLYLCIVALATVLLPFISQAQDQIGSGLVGKWLLVSVYEEDSGGQEVDRWGTAPDGQFIASADGSFSFLMVGRNVIRLAGTNAEQACARLRACRETMDRRVIGYTGKFSVSQDGKLSLDIADGLERGWKGVRISADVTWKDTQMHFVAASDPSPTGSFYAHLVWRKAP